MYIEQWGSGIVLDVGSRDLADEAGLTPGLCTALYKNESKMLSINIQKQGLVSRCIQMLKLIAMHLLEDVCSL